MRRAGELVNGWASDWSVRMCRATVPSDWLNVPNGGQSAGLIEAAVLIIHFDGAHAFPIANGFHGAT
jgi:hypothetical protein